MKGKTIFAAGLIIVVIIVIALYLFTANKTPQDDGLTDINMYYINTATGVLEAEKRRIKLPDNREEAVRTVFNEYMGGPQTTTYTLPADNLNNFTNLVYPVDGNESIAKINFTESYNKLSPSEKLLSISSMVYTLTELDYLRNVYFYVNSKPIVNMNGEASERYNRNNVANNPSLEAEKSDRRLVVLYFTNAAQKWLLPEERSIEIKQSQTTEYQIVEQLIQGPLDSSLIPTVTDDVKIRDIKTEEGICYVNLSSEFLAKHTGTAGETMTIYSIVNSLTELDYVNKVQFLIEGEKINDYNGHIDFSKTFERENDIIFKEDEA